MNIFRSDRTKQFPLLAASAGLIIICLLEFLGVFEGINTYLYDAAFRLRGARKTSDKIIIAAVDENTLKQIGRWPIQRTYYSYLLDKLKEAKVIGFDIIISEPSEDDARLIETAKRNGNVVFAVFLNRQLKKVDPLPALLPVRMGHVHVEESIDAVVRGMFHSISGQGVILHSMSSLMFEAMTSSPMSRERADPSPALKDRTGMFQTDYRMISYYGTPGTFLHLSVADIIAGKYSSDFFRNKAVLVGITASGIVDSMATPFSQDRSRMAGVEVHANILNNLFDNNAMRESTDFYRWTFTAVFLLCLLYLFLNTGERVSAIIWLAALIVITAASYSLFAAFHFWIAPTVFYVSFSYGFILSYLIKLDSAAVELDQKHISLQKLLGQEKILSDQHISEKGIIGLLSPEGINTKIHELLQVEQQYEAKLEDTVKERTSELTHALAMISTMSNEMILRLTKAAESKDEDTGAHIARIGYYARAVAEEIGLSGDYVDMLAFSSAMHDIGKIGIPDRILLKQGSLNSDELVIMMTHTTIGSAILANSDYPKIQMSERIAHCHHERWDGTGYPRGLKEEEIPLEARIVTLCDIYDALRSKRPYKKAFDHSLAVQIIREGDGRCMPSHIDPDLLAVFLRIESVFENIFNSYQD